MALAVSRRDYSTWKDIFDDQSRLDNELECISGSKESQKKSYAFEYLVGQFLASVLNLDYIDVNSSPVPQYSVRWSGDSTTMTTVSNNEADIISKCYGFDFIAECTMKAGAHQASQEFAPTIRHYEKFLENPSITAESYIIMIAPSFHSDTFTHFKNNRYRERVALLSCENLGLISSFLSDNPAISHLQVKWLLTGMGKALHDSSNFTDFTSRVKDEIETWGMDILVNNFDRIIGIKSFRVLERIVSSGRRRVGASEVLRELELDPIVRSNLSFWGLPPMDNIERICRTLSIIHSLPVPHTSEPMFEVLDKEDIKTNNLRFLREIGILV